MLWRLRPCSLPRRRGFPGLSSCRTGRACSSAATSIPGDFRIVIGERTNIQDNTRIRCEAGETAIGRDTTLGHNVRLASCRIGERALIGIGAVVAAGTIIEDGVMLAAGAVTLPGQTLEGGWLWAWPARAPAGEARRCQTRSDADHYRALLRLRRSLCPRAGKARGPLKLVRECFTWNGAGNFDRCA